jgi:hypothetical protein
MFIPQTEFQAAENTGSDGQKEAADLGFALVRTGDTAHLIHVGESIGERSCDY